MRDLPIETARSIAKEQYWDIMRLYDVAALSVPIAEEMFDTGFNSGQATVVKFLQRCLNVANRRATLYPDMKVDGLMGRVSIFALRAYLDRRGKNGEVVMLRALNSLQGAFYTDLAERREKDEELVRLDAQQSEDLNMNAVQWYSSRVFIGAVVSIISQLLVLIGQAGRDSG
jgi:lysozyme family protein